jgi:hypothetical protein
MQGIARPSGGDATVMIRGRLRRLGAMTLRDWGTIENHLIQRRRRQILEPILDVFADMPAELWQEAWRAATNRADRIMAVPDEEVTEWINTQEGLAFTLWMLLEKRHPGLFEFEDLIDYVCRLPLGEVEFVRMARDQAATIDRASSQLDWPRNLTPPSRAPQRRTSWKQLFYRLTMPEWSGGRGMDVEAAKNLTLFEARLYASNERNAGGVQRMSLAEAKDLGLVPDGKPKTYADPVAREQELYAKHFGQPMPPDMVERLRARWGKESNVS